MTLEIIRGQTLEISDYSDFDTYEWVTFRSNVGMGPIDMVKWIGISHSFNHMM